MVLVLHYKNTQSVLLQCKLNTKCIAAVQTEHKVCCCITNWSVIKTQRQDKFALPAKLKRTEATNNQSTSGDCMTFQSTWLITDRPNIFVDGKNSFDKKNLPWPGEPGSLRRYVCWDGSMAQVHFGHRSVCCLFVVLREYFKENYHEKRCHKSGRNFEGRVIGATFTKYHEKGHREWIESKDCRGQSVLSLKTVIKLLAALWIGKLPLNQTNFSNFFIFENDIAFNFQKKSKMPRKKHHYFYIGIFLK